MRWPWVLRSTLEALDQARAREIRGLVVDLDRTVQQLADARATLKALESVVNNTVTAQLTQQAHHEKQMVASEARYSDLMTSYRLLRLNGHAPPAEPISIPIERPDPVQAAINARAPDEKTRKAAVLQVARDRQAGLSDVEIIDRIERGNRPAEDFA